MKIDQKFKTKTPIFRKICSFDSNNFRDGEKEKQFDSKSCLKKQIMFSICQRVSESKFYEKLDERRKA